MERRKFLRGLMVGGVAITVSGCGGGGSGATGSATTAGAVVSPAPAPAPAPTPTPTPPPVPTLNGVTIDQAEQEIRSQFTTELAWVTQQRVYATDVTVTSPAEFQTAVAALFDTAANPNVATQNHRIRLAWNGSASLPGLPDARVTVGKVFGTASHYVSGGSVTIAAATGYKPAFANTVHIGAQGVIVHGVGFVRAPMPAELPAAVTGVMIVNGASFPMEPIVHFQDCYFGHVDGFGSMGDFSSAKLTVPSDVPLVNGASTQGLSHFLSFADCRFWGNLNCAKIISRALRMDGCDFSGMSMDAIDLFGHTFARDYYAAAWITRTTIRDFNDTFANRSIHADGIQYCGPMDVHKGMRLLVTDSIIHLAHSYNGDVGMGGGSQAIHGGNNPNLDNQFVIRRCCGLATSGGAFGFSSPKATRPSFVDQCVFTRAGRTPSGFSPDAQPSQDWVIGLTATDGAGAKGVAKKLLVTDTVAGDMYLADDAILQIMKIDPRPGAPDDQRPETLFKGRDFTRGGESSGFVANKFGYDLPNERQSQAKFVGDIWANFQPQTSHDGWGAPDLRALSWRS